MKSVLISIQPKWCELIASGKKTIEVRKSAPKIETPFKCYIYCTESDVHSCFMVGGGEAKLIHCCNYKTAICVGGEVGNGKVIGEFVCDRVDEYSCEFWDDTPDYMSKNHPMEKIQVVDYIDDEDPDWKEYAYVTGNEVENPDDCDLCKNACLTYAEIRNYVGIGDKTFYAWNISDLKIYDKPKELGEFYKVGKHAACKNGERICLYSRITDFCKRCESEIIRPPQSWCYVEGI